MPKPKQLRGLKLLPEVEVLVKRMQEVELQLSELHQSLKTKLPEPERRGTEAHIAALTRKRQWYLARIRRVRPVQELGVGVSENIKSKEAHPR